MAKTPAAKRDLLKAIADIKAESNDSVQDADEDDNEPHSRKVTCPMCGMPTTFDPVYEDLCYAHIRADNE